MYATEVKHLHHDSNTTINNGRVFHAHPRRGYFTELHPHGHIPMLVMHTHHPQPRLSNQKEITILLPVVHKWHF